MHEQIKFEVCCIAQGYHISKKIRLFAKKPESANARYVGYIDYCKDEYGIGDIILLEVKKEFRGRGYGTKLVRYAIDDLRNIGAKEVKFIVSSIIAKNDKTQEELDAKLKAFYRKFGAVEKDNSIMCIDLRKSRK